MNLSEDDKPELNPEPGKQSSKTTSKSLRVEVLDKIATLITAAFGFVAAFAWNETFKVILLGGIGDEVKPIVLISYALFVTIVAVFLTIFVARAAAKARKKIE